MTNRRTKTTVVLKDGQTAVLGGLIRDDTIKNSQRVPCLGSLPLLGRIFQSSHKEEDRTNLQIFITPHIIKSPEEVNIFTTEMKELN